MSDKTLTTEQLDFIIRKNRMYDSDREVKIKRKGKSYTADVKIDAYDSKAQILVVGGTEIKLSEIDTIVFLKTKTAGKETFILK